MISYKKTIFLLIAMVVFSAAVQPTLALELNYPQISSFGAPQVTSGTDIIGYVKYVFVFLVVAAGIFGVISIAISGFIILISAGNPAAITAARERIFGSILGIGLLMFSYIILRTINPQIIGEELRPNPTGAVYYVVPNPDYIPDVGLEYLMFLYYSAPSAEMDISENVTSYDGMENARLYYYCDSSTLNPKNILVWTYDDYDLKFSRNSNGGISTVKELRCGDEPDETNTVDIGQSSGALSFKWEYKEPGVYYYLTDNCGGVSTPVQQITGAIKKFDTTSSDQVPKSLKIVNGPGRKEKYGVILTEKTDDWYQQRTGEIGQCGFPMIVEGYAGILSGFQQLGERCFSSNEVQAGNWPAAAVGSTIAGNVPPRPMQPQSALILKVDYYSSNSNIGGVNFVSDHKTATASYNLIQNRVRESPWYYVVWVPVKQITYTFITTRPWYNYVSFGLIGGTPTAVPSTTTHWTEIHNFNGFFRDWGDTRGDNSWLLNLLTYRQQNLTSTQMCPYGRTCLEDITFKKGAYYVIVYSINSSELESPNMSCQVFNESVFGIKDEQFLKYSRDIYKTIIVPSSNYLK